MSTDGEHSHHSYAKRAPAGSGMLTDLAAVFTEHNIAARLLKTSPPSYEAAARFWQAAHSAPALSPRMKELVLVALHATVTAVDAERVRRHVGRALAAGATETDVLDVLITIVGAANHALYFAVPIFLPRAEGGWASGQRAPPHQPGVADHQERLRPRARLLERAA